MSQPIKTWLLPLSKQGDKTLTPVEYLQKLAKAQDGFYPLGASTQWHGGIHIDRQVLGEIPVTQAIGAIAEGEVIAYRVDNQLLKADYQGKPAQFSSSFTLVRHKLEMPALPARPPEQSDTAATENSATTPAESTQASVPAPTPIQAQAPAQTGVPAPPTIVPQAQAPTLVRATTPEPVPPTATTSTEAQAATPEPASPTATTPAAVPALSLTLYSLSMHLMSWPEYQQNSTLPRPKYWGDNSQEYLVGDKALDPLLGCRVRQNGAGTTVLALLPQGSEIKVGEPVKAGSRWRKLEAIITGCAVPKLATPLAGYVYIGEMQAVAGEINRYRVAEKGTDKEASAKGINIRKEPGKEAVGVVPRGYQLNISEVKQHKNKPWGKIGDIVVHPPESEGECPNKAKLLGGWVYLNELKKLPGSPAKCDEIVQLDPPVVINSGELIGYLGRYQKMSEALNDTAASPLLHFELFTCDDLPGFIAQTKAAASALPEAQKPIIAINSGATLYNSLPADQSIGADMQLIKVTDSKAAGQWVAVNKARELIVSRTRHLGDYTSATKSYALTAAHKTAIARDLAIPAVEIPDTVLFTGLYYSELDSTPAPKSSTTPRRGIRFLLANETAPVWVESTILNEAGKRHELTTIVNAWSNYPLQHGQQPLTGKVGVACLLMGERATRTEQVKDAEGVSWWKVKALDAAGLELHGWAKDQAPDVTRHSPWEWPGFESLTENATTGQLADRMQRNYQMLLDPADYTPLMRKLHLLIHGEKNLLKQTCRPWPGSPVKLPDTPPPGFTVQQLQQAMAKPWLAQQLSRLVVNYESEWYDNGSLSKWHELDELVGEEGLPLWQVEKTERIEKLLWWDKLAGKQGLNRTGKAWFLHPVGVVENFGVGEENYHYYVDKDGFVQEAQIIKYHVPKLERKNISNVNAIVLHRTFGKGSALNVISYWKSTQNKFNVGAHFIIDKDGKIYQVLSLKKSANHVGFTRPKSEERARKTRSNFSKAEIERKFLAEIKKSYPERYPYNADSIGIEVHAWWDEKTKLWDDATPEQLCSIKKLVNILQKEFNLNDEDLYQHQCISYKTSGEGKNLYPPADNNGNIDPKYY